MYSPVEPHVRQAAVQRDHVAGHQVELVDLEHLLHLVLGVLRDVDCLAHLPRALVAPRDHRWGGERWAVSYLNLNQSSLSNTLPFKSLGSLRNVLI